MVYYLVFKTNLSFRISFLSVLPTRPKFRNSAEIRYFWPMKFQKISATKFWFKSARYGRNFNIWPKLAKIRQKMTQKCLKFLKQI